ncbi:MAG TPA: T9SS type A sorting domain-containing protein [Bacteroidia bacterium]|nr:T9SS type A sorting domain-containing protein [Bacteroidia bacterium]
MKKGLLLVIGVTATLGMVAQQQVRVAKKMNLTLEQTKNADAESPSFYSNANASQRSGANPTVQVAGTMFSSSYNANTLLVAQSNCMTANQALGVALFTHRMSFDWSVAGVNSGYIQGTWTTNNGTSWDSMYFDNDGSQLFRYPSGAIINPVGNTTMSNAWLAVVGPWTPTAGWEGYYQCAAPIIPGMGNTGVGVASNNLNSFQRIDMASYSDSSVWVTGELVTNDEVAANGFRGAALNHGVFDGTTVTWTMDSIKPSFHQDGTGANDVYSMTHLTFSANGQIGYCVFFGVQASASTPETRAFQPIVYSTTDGGTTWSAAWAPFDYSTIGIISQNIFPSSAGDIKPWFSMNNGSDMAVDHNGNLHIVCTIESGYSDHDDSLGYTTTFSNIPAGMAHHYIYDVYTTGANTWNAILIDSLVTTNTTTASPFSDGTTPFDLDARIQISSSPSRDHLFYFWADSDPNLAGGENAFGNLYGVGVDWTTDMRTARKQFTNTDDAYWHYTSNNTLISGSTYTIPTSNSIDRDGSHNTATTFDHYYINDVTFDESEFTLAIGINEAVASFGTVATYPNPANESVNVNVTLNNNEAVVITMYNALGQAVITESRNMNTGSNTVQLNTANLDAGVYFLTVAAGTASTTSKVVIQ